MVLGERQKQTLYNRDMFA